MQAELAGFIIEPGNLWRRRIARRYLDLAPAIVSAGREAVFKCAAEPGIRIEMRNVPWSEDPLASGDAWIRAAAMDRAGIKSQIIYPTFGWSLFSIRDQGLQAACMRSYNNWVFDLCIANPARFLRAVLVAPGRAGHDELERCVKSRISAVKVKCAIVCVKDGERIEDVLQAAAASDIPVVLVRAGTATPMSDIAALSRDSEELARTHASAGARFIVLERVNGPRIASRSL